MELACCSGLCDFVDNLSGTFILHAGYKNELSSGAKFVENWKRGELPVKGKK
jgi:hypothetical protein